MAELSDQLKILGKRSLASTWGYTAPRVRILTAALLGSQEAREDPQGRIWVSVRRLSRAEAGVQSGAVVGYKVELG